MAKSNAKPNAKQKVERKRVSVDELKKFVGEFQKADSIQDVVAAMNWRIEKVRTQATRLRKRGVALRDFPRGAKLSDADVEALQELCK